MIILRSFKNHLENRDQTEFGLTSDGAMGQKSLFCDKISERILIPLYEVQRAKQRNSSTQLKALDKYLTLKNSQISLIENKTCQTLTKWPKIDQKYKNYQNIPNKPNKTTFPTIFRHFMKW